MTTTRKQPEPARKAFARWLLNVSITLIGLVLLLLVMMAARTKK